MIAITGTPGVGKSTVSKVFCEVQDCNLYDITKIVKENGLYYEKDESLDSYVVNFDKLKEFFEKEFISNEKNKSNKSVVIEGHVSQHLELDYDYIIVLRCEPKIIEERLKKRGYSESKVHENVEAEIMDVCLIEALESAQNNENIKIHEIDCTNKNPDEVVKEMITAISTNNLAYGTVSWLEMYFDYLQ
ncbi:adenylate kinase [Methanococcus voltae]|uniref:adenylate kinase family protein n=1 Tax=Methanococcus voltae TaxID=2188 RepID=UPI001FD8F870|nr:AAA family ATPase [Methanococcus voltae]MBP2143063.1 adenylate kinase [Methanococcus voltae]